MGARMDFSSLAPSFFFHSTQRFPNIASEVLSCDSLTIVDALSRPVCGRAEDVVCGVCVSLSLSLCVCVCMWKRGGGKKKRNRRMFRKGDEREGKGGREKRGDIAWE